MFWEPGVSFSIHKYMKVFYPIQLIIYILRRRRKDESSGTYHYLSKPEVKNTKVANLRDPSYIDTVFGRK